MLYVASPSSGSNLKMEAACISEILATLPISTWYNHPRAELASTDCHRDSLKSETESEHYGLSGSDAV
jgi:hypothetical protein